MKYYTTFFSAFLLVLASLPVYNYMVDWYGVFQGVDDKGVVYVRKSPEQSASAQNVQHPYFRFHRAVDFVKRNNAACVLAMGSSRVEALFDDEEMSHAFKMPFTKLQYNNSPVEEALHNVRLLAAYDAMPKRLVIGIDDFSLFKRGLNTEANRMPPPLSTKEYYEYWKTLLFRWPSLQNFHDSVSHAPVAYRPLSATTGRAPISQPNPDLYLMPANDNYRGEYFVDESINDVAQILSIAKAHNTTVDFFITPRFVSTYYMRDHAALHDFKRKLARLTPFYDFSGVVYENSSPRFWLETSHQTSEIGLIVGGIISSGEGEKFWGKRVTEANVDEHLSALRRNLIANIDAWLKAKPDGDIHPRLYPWLFEHYEARDVDLAKVAKFDPETWLASGGPSANLTSTAYSVNIALPPQKHADRIELSITGAPASFYRKDRFRRYIDVSVDGRPYGEMMFGVVRDKGAISNEKTLTVLGDFSKETTLSFVVRPDKNSTAAVEPGFTLGSRLRVISTGNRVHPDAMSFHFGGDLPPSAFSKPSPLAQENLALNNARLEDLRSIEAALQRYKAAHRKYPVSSGWDGLYTKFGRASTNWIPGLTPTYITALPRDPRRNADGAQQYFYRSNGTSYKLIAHGISSLAGVDSKFVDPRRPASAFGFWSDDAMNW